MAPWTIWFKVADAKRWQPLEPFRSLPTGHYRLAVRLPVAFKYLQWRWKFFPATGQVQNHHFQGRTNQEGLISLLDLHTVQPGTWQLTAQPDLFDHLCGETWRIQFQFQIISQATPANPVVTMPQLGSEAEKVAENDAIVPHLPQTAVPAMAISPVTPRKSTETEAVSPPEQKNPSKISPFRSVNYALELIYPELENPIQVDITVMLDERRKPSKLDLPDPRRMVGSLYHQSRPSKSPLPPKLSRLR